MEMDASDRDELVRMEDRIKYLEDRKARFRKGGGQRGIDDQHKRGKLTIRERLEILIDPGTFVEYDMLATSIGKDFGLDRAETPGDGCVSGWGLINGRKVWVYGHDFTLMGGAWGGMSVRKFLRTMDRAYEMGTPIILLDDSGGRRPQEQQTDEKRGETFFKHVHYSGCMPQLTLVMGPVAGGPCYGPVLTDFIFMVRKTSHMFIGGPPVVKAMIGEDVTAEELGGADLHASVSGTADLAVENDKECLLKGRELLSFLPQNCNEKPPRLQPTDDPNRMDTDLNSVLPDDKTKPYDMHLVIKKIVDNGEFFEIKPKYARNIIVGYARLDGHPVGIVASQPAWMGGTLNVDAADKGARFIRTCDCFNVPILNVLDSPGYLVGTQMEKAGIIRHGAKMLYAQSETTVPKITLITRTASGGAHSGMGSRGTGVDISFAWPTAEIGTFGVNAAMSILLRTRAMKEDLEKLPTEEAKKEQIEKWRKEYYLKNIDLYNVGPWRHVDDIIQPKESRPALIKAFEILREKKMTRPYRKHGNIPL